MDERIRLSSTDSTNSVNKENFLDIDIKQHTKLFPFPSLSYTIDQREQFEKERAESTKYRLILTINPYCSNILFNAVTEIVQNEGTDNPNDLKIASSEGISISNTGDYTIRGKNTDVTNTDMVRNTEYSNGSNPFVYHCGYDIFNNHILRNQTFKLVNTYINNSERNDFNTIRDMMRYSDGKDVVLRKRTDVNTINDNGVRHLYLKDDILSLIDSINANISEQNGWWGFNNRSSIMSSVFVSDDDKNEWEDMKISKVFNNDHSACEFVEMYPDSTLYSFNPKYNKFQNREEHNWDICITYPYKNDDTKPLVSGGLLLASYQQTIGTSGQKILLFRSYVKHNLKRGDEIRLFYYKKEPEENENQNVIFNEISDMSFKVVDTGNLENDYDDYYFYLNDVDEILNEIGETENEISDNYTFKFAKVVNNLNCKYYYRKFKKVPNLKFKKEELTEEIGQNRETFDNYVNVNCKKNGKMINFSKEQYPLGFSKTIYGDNITQITFTDTIDIDHLRDNLNRPLTELYVTIIKRNKGHELWYKKDKSNDDLKNIEFSHCFGKVISGIDVHGEWTDDDTTNGILLKRPKISDVTLLNNNSANLLDENITIDNDEFFGDVVELNEYEMRETILSDVYFRFNTEQREHNFVDGEINCGKFIFDEIETDDYDRNGFVCNQSDMDDVNTEGDEDIKTTYRPEGYYYKAHYPLLVREFGAMKQASHKELVVSSCNPRQANGMFIEVVTALRSGVKSGDVIFLCDNENHISIPLFVNCVLSNVRFLLSPMLPSDDENYKSVFDIVSGLLHSDEKTITSDDITNGYRWMDENGHMHIAQGEIKDEDVIIESDLGKTIYDYSNPKYLLRIKNNDIPSYAHEVGTNIYLWRDLLTVGNKDSVDLKEYPFANGHFYINKEINFFLKRQDPFDYNGSYAGSIYPNDIYGNIKKADNYEYKDETHVIC